MNPIRHVKTIPKRKDVKVRRSGKIITFDVDMKPLIPDGSKVVNSDGKVIGIVRKIGMIG